MLIVARPTIQEETGKMLKYQLADNGKRGGGSEVATVGKLFFNGNAVFELPVKVQSLESDTPGEGRRWRVLWAGGALPEPKLTALANVGPANPREFTEVTSTTEVVAPLTNATGGASVRIEDGAGVHVPRLVAVRSGESYKGDDWIGLRMREASVVRGIGVLPVFAGSKTHTSARGTPGVVSCGSPAPGTLAIEGSVRCCPRWAGVMKARAGEPANTISRGSSPTSSVRATRP